MSSSYREFVDSREAYSVQEQLAYEYGEDVRAEYEPTADDWADFEEWLDSSNRPTDKEINDELTEAWLETSRFFEPSLST